MSHNHGSGNDDEDTSGHMMSMSFHLGYSEVILFDAWTTSDVGIFVLSTFGVFVCAILYEGLKYYREKLFNDYTQAELARQVQYKNSEMGGPEKKSFRDHILSPVHIVQTALHFVQVIISYLLMLVVMTYNLWLFMAVVIGATVGYFIFGWIRNRSIDITEHCH